MNPKKPEDNSVISCNGQFVTGVVSDQSDLSKCAKYSKSICEKWDQILSSDKNTALLSQLANKAKECTQILNDYSQLRQSMNTLFQGEIKSSEGEISKNFNLATNPNNDSRRSNVEIKQSPESSSISLPYKDVIERIDACNNYQSLFVSDLTRAKNRLSADLGDEPKPAKKTKSSKTSTRQ